MSAKAETRKKKYNSNKSLLTNPYCSAIFNTRFVFVVCSYLAYLNLSHTHTLQVDWKVTHCTADVVIIVRFE